MKTVGIIGCGMIGSTVARLAIDAGYDVVLSNSRGPETLQDLVAELGPKSTAATREGAAQAGDLVVISVPPPAYSDLGNLPLAGKIVIDTGNYYAGRDGAMPGLVDQSLTDSEYLSRHLTGAEVVKAFNNIFFLHLGKLARPADAADRSALPVAGNNADAKAAVLQFVESIGYTAVDAGPLADSWRQQPGAPAYSPLYGFLDVPENLTGDWSVQHEGTPVGEDTLRAALAAAER